MKWMVILLTALFLASCGPATVNGVDPYVAAEQARNEAEAAQSKAEFYETQLTGTAQAPIIAITSSAAALMLSVEQAKETEISAIKTQTAAASATAALWTQTPSPTPTINVTSTLIVEKMNAEIEAIRLDTEKKQLTNKFWAVILPIFLLVVLMAIGYVAISYSRERKHNIIERGDGDAPIVINRVTGEIVDQDANPNYTTGVSESLVRQMFEQWLERKYGFQTKYPRITAERQDIV